MPAQNGCGTVGIRNAARLETWVIGTTGDAGRIAGGMWRASCIWRGQRYRAIYRTSAEKVGRYALGWRGGHARGRIASNLRHRWIGKWYRQPEGRPSMIRVTACPIMQRGEPTMPLVYTIGVSFDKFCAFSTIANRCYNPMVRYRLRTSTEPEVTRKWYQQPKPQPLTPETDGRIYRGGGNKVIPAQTELPANGGAACTGRIRTRQKERWESASGIERCSMPDWERHARLEGRASRFPHPCIHVWPRGSTGRQAVNGTSNRSGIEVLANNP